jgi:IS5 family transposase
VPGRFHTDYEAVKTVFLLQFFNPSSKLFKPFLAISKRKMTRRKNNATKIRETVESISENPYMQYFIGLASFEMKAPFHHSMMTHFRKRLVNVLAEINEIVAIEGAKAAMDDDNNDPDGGTKGNVQARSKEPAPSLSSGQQEWEFEETEGRSAEHEIHHEPMKKATLTEASPIADEAAAHRTSSCKTPPAVMNENAPTLPNQGSLLVDATCAPADIAYPTDLNLLNEAREKLESIIDVLHRPMIGIEPKPRTYREKARKQYLVVSKQ